ncbi:hypothetical protein AeMF1_021863 [Aphanomyces euteiches]|nr:hypothetical protein AeMF1_021863 [Aphanomyces euteiches]KAH9185009.1 hypothetical protein AeNC1_013016 [Aphanomyces euteiches]
MAQFALLNLSLKNLTDWSSVRMNSGLEILNVSHNLLADVSTTFPPSLRVLDLSYNQLGSFNFSLAPSLTQLSLRANHIENLVLTLDTFPANLRLLDLADNPSLQLYVDTTVFEKLTASGFTLLLTSNLTLLQPPSQGKQDERSQRSRATRQDSQRKPQRSWRWSPCFYLASVGLFAAFGAVDGVKTMCTFAALSAAHSVCRKIVRCISRQNRSTVVGDSVDFVSSVRWRDDKDVDRRRQPAEALDGV